MSEKIYLPLYFSWVEKTKKLSDQEFGKLIRAIVDYSCTKKITEGFSDAGEMAYLFMCETISRSEINSINGRLGAEKKKQASRELQGGFEGASSSVKTKIEIEKEIKRETNIEIKHTPPLSPSDEGEKEEPKEINAFEGRFERFWEAYPRKQGKAAAKKAFLKIKPSDALTVKMIGAIEKQKKSRDWTKHNGEFIPYPTTWLNQGRWEDEVVEYVPEEEKPKHSSFTVDEAFSKARQRAYGEVDGQNASISNDEPAKMLPSISKDEAVKMLEKAIRRSYQ